ncbi:hypothetical protein AMECASPLE_021634 [Ameca splendens]|uniref:Uncharacterized protein n=1 Tax=Ameca splendens TaxID=208324 RepID=A0ABV0YF06_9TELE
MPKKSGFYFIIKISQIFCSPAPQEVSVLPDIALGHVLYSLTGVPPQSNSPPATVPESGHTLHTQGCLTPELYFGAGPVLMWSKCQKGLISPFNKLSQTK